jgi:serine/threonine protein kinase
MSVPLAPGSRLGEYEIVSLLGVGGMGEVYRARDARLQRDVALKLLPELWAADPDRRDRFRREGLAVAALNHPHIVTIHSVEDAGSTVFLTMELVSGRSLASALQSGPLALERILTVGIAIADAVSAAHQKGITHRDLKPANVILGEGDHAGRVKVVDFGLAKAIAPGVDRESGAGQAIANSPTFTSPAVTQHGVILGTAAYMSPEQAEGRAVDHRSDVFSLGVVLYEMSTGRQPFTGDTSLSVLSSILKDTPRPVTELNPSLPQELSRIIRRALAKDPERRYQDARDLRSDLEDAKASLESGEATAKPLPSPRKAPRALPWAAAVTLLIGAAAVGFWLRRDSLPASSPPASAPPAFADLRITQLTTSGNAERPAISPDGRFVAYVQRDGNDYSLWLRETANTSNGQIVAAQPGVTLLGATFTPDGTSIVFVRKDGKSTDLWRVPFLGGTPRPFVADVDSPVSWSPKGSRMAFFRSRITPTLSFHLFVATAAGEGERELASSVPGELWITLTAPWRPSIAPAWSPDGRFIAVAATTSEARNRAIVVDSETGSMQGIPVPSGIIYGLGWLNDESLVINQPPPIGSPTQLFRLPYPAGGLARLTNDPNDYVGVSLTADRGGLVTARREGRMDIWVGDAGGIAGTDVVRRAPISVDRLAWSSDRLLYGTISGGRAAIMRIVPGRAGAEEVVLDAFTPAVTSDGSTIVFVSSSSEDPFSLWKADASGRRIAILAPSASAEQVVVTPDDRSVIYNSVGGDTASIWTVPLDRGKPTKLVDGVGGSVSPNGRSMAFTDSRARLMVCDLPGCTAPRPIGPAPFGAPIAWTPDGSGVAYATDGNIWVQSLAAGPPRQLTRFTDNRPIGSFAWSRDGKRQAISRSTITNDIVLLQGLR